jgi:hypothetical protein
MQEETKKIQNNQIYKSNIIAHVFRPLPDMNLYSELMNYIKSNKIKAACILSCVGSLKEINIRLASGKTFLTKKENFEIVSLVGSISEERNHIHISLSDDKGNAFGGHLMPENNLVYTTAEIVIGEFAKLVFHEETCEKSTWPELVVEKKSD